MDLEKNLEEGLPTDFCVPIVYKIFMIYTSFFLQYVYLYDYHALPSAFMIIL